MVDSMVLAGRGRMLLPPGDAAPARLTLEADGFGLGIGDARRAAAYRDLETIAIQDGAALLSIGSGTGAERVLLDQFGAAQGQLVRELRDRRLRQRAADGLVSLDADQPIDLVEYETVDDHGVAQLAYHPWGAILAPLDERQPTVRIRRSAISAVSAIVERGVAEISRIADEDSASAPLRLVGLGAAARIHADRFEALRAAALDDAARAVAHLIPDAPYGVRQEAGRRLIDGRPVRPADLPTGWSPLEAAVLVDPTFAASYRAMVDRAGELASDRAIALAPVEPGGEEWRTWFLVALPGNLLALELVSEGAHATYTFRVAPRATFVPGAPDRAAIDATIRVVSEALVDARFLREPMALSDAALARPEHLRYRLALTAIPSLAAARARFVARIVHRDDASWAAALDDLIAWHGSARDDAAVWPGRSAQDELVGEAIAQGVP